MKNNFIHPEKQHNFILAKTALDEARVEGEFSRFSYVMDYVSEDPYNDKGLGLPVEEYTDLKHDYIQWKSKLPA